jgi:DNA-binding transcriptional LysR family regulator
MIDVRQLEVLSAAADTGSLTAAAESLGLSQSTASHHLARLEATAGVELLIRQRRGVVLTDAGAALLAHGRAVLDRLALAEAELADRRESRVGSISIYSFPTALIDLVPRAIQRLLDSEPQIKVNLAVGPSDQAIAALAAGEADLAITFHVDTEPPLASGLDRVVLLEDPMMVVLPHDHPLASRKRVALRELAGSRWILGATAGADAITYQALQADSIDPDVLVETSDLQAVHGMVAAGLGVALGPASALRHARRDIVVRPLSTPTLARTIEAIVRSSDTRRVTADLVQQLNEVAETLRRKRPRCGRLGRAGSSAQR